MRIAEMRSLREWTQQQLADHAGLKLSPVAKVEQGGGAWMST